MTAVTFTATGLRDVRAFETVAEYGAGYLNPLIGNSAAETCAKIENVMQFLHRTVDRGDDLCEVQPALALIVQTIWSAVQYEGQMADADDGKPGRRPNDG